MKKLVTLVLVAMLAFLVVVAFSPPVLGFTPAESTELTYDVQQTAPVDGLPGAVADLPSENSLARSLTAVHYLGSMCPVKYNTGQPYATKDAAPPLFLPLRAA